MCQSAVSFAPIGSHFNFSPQSYEKLKLEPAYFILPVAATIIALPLAFSMEAS